MAEKFLDYDRLIVLWQQIKQNFVSSADYIAYTSAEQTKLSGIEDGAEVNIIEGITVNNTAVSPDNNRNVSLTIPTTSDIQTLIASAISDVIRISFTVVSDYEHLPNPGVAGTIYLVSTGASTGQNIYDEYIYVSITESGTTTSRYEKIGTTAVDLSGYWQTSGSATNSLVAMSNQDVLDAITAATATPSSGS